MEFERNIGGFDRLVRAVLAVTLTIVALRALQSGRRGRATLASIVAVGFALNAVTCFCGLNRKLGIDTTQQETDN